MKLTKSTKTILMNIFSTVLMAVFLFSTSTLTVVLTNQKVLQASTSQNISREKLYPHDEPRPYDDPEAGKTDRFIVKYKENKATSFKSKLPYTLLSSNSIDSIKESLESSSVLPVSASNRSQTGNESRSSASRYYDMELLILAEKVFPSEFEEVLIATGAYNDIIYIQPDYELEIASIVVSPTTLAGTNSNPLSTTSSSSPAVIVAVIDTGVDPLHPAYSSYLHPATPNVYDSSNALAFAHGTHIAGIIAGEATLYGTNVQILVLPVFSNGYAYTSDILAAIEAAELLGASVVNCSFGNTSFNQALYDAMEASSMLFVCAAGNGREDLQAKGVYPASFGLDNIISVGSVNADMGYSYFSNYNGVDIVAVGRDVNSAIPSGGYGPMTGTSMAAAKVTGAAAIILANNLTFSSTDIAERILYSADKYTHLYNKVKYGRYLSINNALANISGSVLTVQYQDDFDVHGYAPTPEENWALFSSLEVVQIVAGSYHTLALMSDGTVWAWGNNSSGQCGNGSASDQEVLAQVIGLGNIISISAGNSHSLAVKSDGTVWAWGGNHYGQIGDGTTTHRYTPVQVSGLTGVIEITAGVLHSLAVKSDSTVWAWGYNSNGQIGDGTTIQRIVPVQVNGILGATKVSAGLYHSLAVKSELQALHDLRKAGKKTFFIPYN